MRYTYDDVVRENAKRDIEYATFFADYCEAERVEEYSDAEKQPLIDFEAFVHGPIADVLRDLDSADMTDDRALQLLTSFSFRTSPYFYYLGLAYFPERVVASCVLNRWWNTLRFMVREFDVEYYSHCEDLLFMLYGAKSIFGFTMRDPVPTTSP